MCKIIWGIKKNLPEAFLAEWKSKVAECIEEKVAKLQSNNICNIWKIHISINQ